MKSQFSVNLSEVCRGVDNVGREGLVNLIDYKPPEFIGVCVTRGRLHENGNVYFRIMLSKYEFSPDDQTGIDFLLMKNQCAHEPPIYMFSITNRWLKRIRRRRLKFPFRSV